MIPTLGSWDCEILCLVLDENNLKVGNLGEAIFGLVMVFQGSSYAEFDFDGKRSTLFTLFSRFQFSFDD